MCNLKVPIPMTCMGLPTKNVSKNAKNGIGMSEIHSISMIFTKLTVSHSILNQNSCSLAYFKGYWYVNCYLYLYPSEFLPVTHAGTLYLCIFLLIREMHRFFVPTQVTGEDIRGIGIGSNHSTRDLQNMSKNIFFGKELNEIQLIL